MNQKVLTKDSVITWGKNRGANVEELAAKQPEYVLILNRSKFFKVDAPVLCIAIQHVPRNHFLLKPWQEPLEDWRKLQQYYSHKN